ncbi:MAG: SDR family oxidoreductase [Verrucomicrobiota bacterium]
MPHVLITGATRGLGLALARGFAAAGWTVSGCGTRHDVLEALSEELGESHHFQVCDVSDANSVAQLANVILPCLGPPDLLINNAALINANAPLWEVPADEFSRLIDVNLKGVHLVIRAFLPSMIERGQGIVVNLSSGWGRSTSPEVAPYCATKWGIEGLTQALAQELPDGLAAIPLNPGIINTDMLQSCFGPGADDCPTPEEWARIAVPYLMAIGIDDNGNVLTVGPVPTY